VTHLACYPYGAGHADEGVCLRLEMGKYRILLDCGLHNLASSDLPLADLPIADVVICSHAHGDHARGLLALRDRFPRLPIYASEVTTQLLPLNWLDQDLSQQPLLCQALPWRTAIEILPNLMVELFPAGHLPGAAAVLLTYTGDDGRRPTGGHRPVRVFYTGDFFLSNERLVEGLKLDEVRGLAPDVLIVEGSYGTSRRSRRRQQENLLMERMDRAIAAEQSILLPASPLGLAPELLFLLRSHNLFSGRSLDIWVHGAVVQACHLYLEILNSLPLSVQNFAQYQSLFWDTKVQPRTAALSAQQLAFLGDRNFNGKSTIILTDNRADFSQFCRSGNWLVLLPESSQYQSEWLAQQKVDRKSKAVITAETYWLSEHSDGNATLQLIHNLRPQYVLMVHGELEQLADFANLEELNSRYKVLIPLPGVLLELPIGEKVETIVLPERRYDGEVVETEAGVVMTLSAELMNDPRWQAFADTGVVETYWRGEELVIRGVSAREMRGRMSQAGERSCFYCQFYRSGRCTNFASPLVGLQVTPDGYCPSFVALPPQIG
jgi:Cft2 family RNA processing exonuclease